MFRLLAAFSLQPPLYYHSEIEDKRLRELSIIEYRIQMTKRTVSQLYYLSLSIFLCILLHILRFQFVSGGLTRLPQRESLPTHRIERYLLSLLLLSIGKNERKKSISIVDIYYIYVYYIYLSNGEDEERTQQGLIFVGWILFPILQSLSSYSLHVEYSKEEDRRQKIDRSSKSK